MLDIGNYFCINPAYSNHDVNMSHCMNIQGYNSSVGYHRNVFIMPFRKVIGMKRFETGEKLPCELLHDQLLEQVVTIEKVKKVLEKTMGKKGIGEDEIDHLAHYLMNFFGYGEYVIDNVLSSEDRDVFYMLEEEGILKTSREEINLLKGKVWRIHYWILRKREILQQAIETEQVETEEDEFSSLYSEISDEVWSRG